MFNRHRVAFGMVNMTAIFQKYIFFSSTTERSEEINQYLNCVNIYPFDIDEKEFRADFNPSCLDFPGEKKAQMTESVVNLMKKISTISNTNLLKKSGGLLNKRSVETEVEWIGKHKSPLPENKFEAIY